MHNNDQKPDTAGLGILLGVMLGTFMAWLFFAVALRQPALCPIDENQAICSREWLNILAPLGGILISAWLIVRQIKISLGQLIPPSLEYFERTNKHLNSTRWMVTQIESYLKRSKDIYRSKLPIRTKIDITDSSIKAVDLKQMNFHIISNHLDEGDHDRVIRISGIWNDYAEKLTILSLKMNESESNNGGNENLEELICKHIEEIVTLAEDYKEEATAVRERLTEVFMENQKRMLKLRRSVIGLIAD